MRYFGFIIFFTVFFSIYIGGNYYVFTRGWQAIPNIFWLKVLYIILFIILAASFILNRFTGHTDLITFHHALAWTGSFWLAALVYFFFAVLLIDIIRLINSGLHFLPLCATPEYTKLKIIALCSSIFVVVILLAAGFYNASHPVIKNLDIGISKLSGKKEIKIVAVSDIHMGTIVENGRLNKLVNLVNAQNPDLIVLAGDILDEVQSPILHEHLGTPLKRLSAPLGVYAILGNHEYYGGIEKSIKYIRSLNLKLLIDSVVNIDQVLTLIGRDDIGSVNRYRKKRKSISELMAGVDTLMPVVLLDHQPYNLKEVTGCGIDLQISGHTHNGQFWPFNYLTRAIFELSWGYKKIGTTHFYVSSGYGTWGPPIRIGNKPEIVVFNIRMKDQKPN
jgi:predicted MPP superfamily phosphohydrolase